MNCVERLLAKDSLFSDAQAEAETSAGDSLLLERRTTTIFEDDPERWIRNNIVGRNMLLKAQFLGRMGLGPRAMTSLSRETIQRMSKTHARNKRQIEIEEEQTVEVFNDDAELEIDRCYSNIEGDFAMNFFKKTDDEMRNRYIHKLINMKIMKTEPMKKHQTMFIFDWDDTLLCTHYLGGLGFVDIPAELLAPLDAIDDLASKLLLKACELGQTFIITNSAEGWVQYSGRLFLPKTYQVIIDQDIHVISARTEYQEIFPGDSHRWKVEAFLGIERMFDKNIITNLVCVGDSRIEIDAAHILAQKFSQAIIKTVKLRGHPKPDELVKQQALILEKIEQIYLSARNLTIRLERKPQKNDAA